jgi:hypothetical protein
MNVLGFEPSRPGRPGLKSGYPRLGPGWPMLMKNDVAGVRP